MSVEPEPRTITAADTARFGLANGTSDTTQPGGVTGYDRARFVVENGIASVILPRVALPMNGGDGWDRPRIVGDGQRAFLVKPLDEGINGSSLNGNQMGEFVVIFPDEVKFTLYWKYPRKAKLDEISRLKADGITFIDTSIRDYRYSNRFIAVRERREWE